MRAKLELILKLIIHDSEFLGAIVLPLVMGCGPYSTMLLSLVLISYELM